MPLKLEDAWSVKYDLESLKKWASIRAEGTPQFLINGTYYTDSLPEASLGILAVLKENFCRTKMAQIAVELRNKGVVVELDFDFDAHLSAEETAKLAREQAAASLEAAERENNSRKNDYPDPDSD